MYIRSNLILYRGKPIPEKKGLKKYIWGYPMEMSTDIFISAKTKVNLAKDFVLTNLSVTTVKGKRVIVKVFKVPKNFSRDKVIS